MTNDHRTSVHDCPNELKNTWAMGWLTVPSRTLGRSDPMQNASDTLIADVELGHIQPLWTALYGPTPS